MPRKQIANFSVEYLQILDEKGNVDKALEPKLSNDDLLKLYRWMMLARESDQKMLNLQRQGRIGTFAPGTGQEAISTTFAFAMTEQDWFVGAFRELGGRLVRGEKLHHALLYYNGYEEGSYVPEAPRTLPISIIVGSQALHAVGLGYAMKYKGEKNAAAVTFFGDGATSEGDFHEALNIAAVWQAPVVFVCQNNQWAISMSRKNQTKSETIAQKAIAYGIPGIQVDGNDALAMYVAARETLDRAYRGEGPSLIEAVTYRLMMHTTADDPKKYRSEEEVKEWWEKDPLKRFRIYLEIKGIMDDKKHQQLEEDIKAEIEAEVAKFESMKDFKPDNAFDHVWAKPSQDLEEQRQHFLARQARRQPNG
jgi:pyruvate dehydrogenase E1 component alpha subunit